MYKDKASKRFSSDLGEGGLAVALTLSFLALNKKSRRVLNMGSDTNTELPGEVLRHVEIAEKFLAEGRELIDKDPVQASEKLYKAAEEAVKALAIALNLPEARKAIESGGWWSKLLEKAAQGVAKALGIKEFILWWDTAFKLHVDGFHEARLSSEDVKERYEYIEAMVNMVKRILQKQRSPHK
jgi:hypothetical protein